MSGEWSYAADRSSPQQRLVPMFDRRGLLTGADERAAAKPATKQHCDADSLASLAHRVGGSTGSGRAGLNGRMSSTEAPARPGTSVLDRPDVDEAPVEDRPWVVIVWNDPINLMSYVTFVLQKLFGYDREKATALMLDVHEKGRAVVASDSREQSELHVFRLHEHGLWATLEHDE